MSMMDKSQYFDEKSDYEDKVVEGPPKDKSQYFDEQSDYKVVEEPPKKKVKRSSDSSMFDQLFRNVQEKFNIKFLESESEDDDGDTESEDDEDEA
jgi:hypothetical protein